MLTDYHAKYFAHEIDKKSAPNSIEKFGATLVDAQVDLNPHQVDAALFAFRSPLSKGAVLADEVGLGKTIETGLLISQKWAERKRKILILCPASLRKQWQQELLDKFFISSIILEARSFNAEIKKGNFNPFLNDSIFICSYQFARSKEVYVEQTNWDLAVIDEAHRLRNVYKTSNKIGRAIKNALAKVPKILLTATPLQNSLLELYGLVSIIDDHAFGDLKSFKAQYSRVSADSDPAVFTDLKKRLAPICKRTLRRQVIEYINYTNRIALVEEFFPREDELRLYELVSDYLRRDQLYALPNSQRSLLTLILRKLLSSSTYAITGTLAALVNRLEVLLQNQKKLKEVPEDISGDYENYDEDKDEWDDSDDTAQEEEIEILTESEIQDVKSELADLREFYNLALGIKKNSKGEKLMQALERGFSELSRLGAARKALIFTESKRTQEYVKEILEQNGYKDQVVLFNGSNTDNHSKEVYKNWVETNKHTDKVTGSRTSDMRAALVDHFREKATIMIATEAAAEGVNLQFCSFLVNYDLPWNPQRVEQRIGRCHRYGQKFDVVVLNFLNKSNAADQRVYELLNEKFKLFDGVFGASDEVLGSIESGIDFEKRIAKIYQECRSQEDIEKAFNELQSELDPEIQTSLQNTRQQLLENFDEEVHEKLKINLQETKVYINKYEQWLWGITKYFLNSYADFDDSELSFRIKNQLFEDQKFLPGPYKIGRKIESCNNYRIHHPIAQSIIKKCKELPTESVRLKFLYTDSPKKISTIEPLVGKTGWMLVRKIEISTFEKEDHIVGIGICNDETFLDSEQCHRMFSLSADQGVSVACPDEIKTKLNDKYHSDKQEILEVIEERDSDFFEEEIQKLDAWADDQKRGLEIQIKEMDAEIKQLKKDARKIPGLKEKVVLQRKQKSLESKRTDLRKKLFEAQDEIDKRKDSLLDDVEKRLEQHLKEEDVFLIEWEIV